MFSILGIFACAMTAIYIIWVGVLPHFGRICSKCKSYHNNNGLHECHKSISYYLQDIPINIPCTDKEISEKFNNMSGYDKDGNIITFRVTDEPSCTIYEYNSDNHVLTLYRKRFNEDMAVYGYKQVVKELNECGFVVNDSVDKNRDWGCSYFKNKCSGLFVFLYSIYLHYC